MCKSSMASSKRKRTRICLLSLAICTWSSLPPRAFHFEALPEVVRIFVLILRYSHHRMCSTVYIASTQDSEVRA